MGKHNFGKYKPKVIENVVSNYNAKTEALNKQVGAAPLSEFHRQQVSNSLITNCEPAIPFTFNTALTLTPSVNKTVDTLKSTLAPLVPVIPEFTASMLPPSHDMELDDGSVNTDAHSTPARSKSSMNVDGVSTPHQLRSASKSSVTSKSTPRSTPVTGRSWAPDADIAQKASTLAAPNKSKALASPFQRRSAIKARFVENRDRARLIQAQQAADKAEEKRRAAERAKQKEANTKKSEIVQTISDTRKIKKMSKKQLRTIEKR